MKFCSSCGDSLTILSLSDPYPYLCGQCQQDLWEEISLLDLEEQLYIALEIADRKEVSSLGFKRLL